MDYERARFNMIEQQIRPWDVLDQEVLSLLAVMRREDFVPAAYRSLAFVDMEIPLLKGAQGSSKIMLAPKIEARMLQELAVRRHESVLEIGAGSGYMAALLAQHARHVTSVEIDAQIVAMARDNLARAAIGNVEVAQGDGARGWGSERYDVICVSGGLPLLPQALLDQLKVGGRLAAFVGGEPVMEAQLVTRLSEREFKTVNLFETQVAFLEGAAQPSRFRF